jgi:hypothetical protein
MYIYCLDITDEGTYDDEATFDDNKDEEDFQIQSDENNSFVLVNTRIDYQYRSDNINDMCLYDFVSTLYKKKMDVADLKYLSNKPTSHEQQKKRLGRPPNIRHAFKAQHPQTKTHLLIEYSEHHVPVLYGPQIPRQDRDDTRERYYRAVLTLFVPWRTVADLCAVNQTWEEAFKSRQEHISVNSWKIIENIQLLHECKKDRDEHLLQAITEAETNKDEIDPVFLPTNRNFDNDNDADDNMELSTLLENLDEYTITATNTSKQTTENEYIEETIDAVEKVGRFDHINSKLQITISSYFRYKTNMCICSDNSSQSVVC